MYNSASSGSELSRAVDLAVALKENADEEMTSLVKAIGGQFVSAGPGGDVIRDGISILPTGRNIYALGG